MQPLGTTAQKVYSAIRDYGEPITSQEIVSLTTLSGTTVYNQTCNLIRRGLIKRLGKGIFRAVEIPTLSQTTFYAFYDPKSGEYGTLRTKPQFDEYLKTYTPYEHEEIHLFTLSGKRKLKKVVRFELQNIFDQKS